MQVPLSQNNSWTGWDSTTSSQSTAKQDAISKMDVEDVFGLIIHAAFGSRWIWNGLRSTRNEIRLDGNQRTNVGETLRSGKTETGCVHALARVVLGNNGLNADS